MNELLLVGASTPSGAAFVEASGSRSLTLVGRRPPLPGSQNPFVPCDLSHAAGFPGTLSGVLVSFAPIWHLAPFLAQMTAQRPEALARLVGVVACSSSSAITKRYASNRFDRSLVKRLMTSEELLQRTCAALAIPCRILAPTLIYGRVGPYGDRNLSQLLQWMRRLPFLPVPAESGLRQPIHARQLAEVALRLAEHLPGVEPGPSSPPPLALGGDESLSYFEMLQRLQTSVGPSDPARRCHLISLPPALFHVMAAPLLPLSPKLFEAVLRIRADLAGFTPAHRILEEAPRSFPVLPLAEV